MIESIMEMLDGQEGMEERMEAHLSIEVPTVYATTGSGIAGKDCITGFCRRGNFHRSGSNDGGDRSPNHQPVRRTAQKCDERCIPVTGLGKLSQLKSSTIVKTRNRCPLARASLIKSMLHCSLT